MAIYTPETNSLYLHIPKCGGFWVDEALRRVGLSRKHIPSPQDATRADCHCTAADYGGTPTLTYTFIRHPQAWYESWWKYQSGQPHNWDEWHWHPTAPLQTLRHSEFTSFIDLVLTHQPGFLTRMYEHYIGPLASPTVDMVCLTERMADDFCSVMSVMAWPCEPLVISKVTPQHRSSSPVGMPVWRPDQLQQILSTERTILEEFYPADESLLTG